MFSLIRSLGLLFFIASFLLLTGCHKEESTTKCPAFSNVIICPFFSPIWNNHDNLIGFNYIPLKNINYNYGYGCPFQADYLYNADSVGFYLIDPSGANLKRALPVTLQTPSFSPDGKWIAWSAHLQIFKMPFDGSNFDTTKIVQLTFSGDNYSPSWSPDTQWIAFDSNQDSPTGLNFIWKMRADGTNARRIAYAPTDGETRDPSWSSDFSITHMRYVAPSINPEVFLMDSAGANVLQLTNENYPGNGSPVQQSNTRNVFFLSEAPGTERPLEINIWKVDQSLQQTKITNFGVTAFSLSSDNKLVYVRFDNARLDNTDGTLWIADVDGLNQKQIGFNVFTQNIK